MQMKTKVPPVRVAVAKRLRELRGLRGFETARAFAQALGVEEDRFTRWERAETEPDFTHIIRICQVLSITTDELFSSSASPPQVTNWWCISAQVPQHTL
jgi:transcriptional regulator with XRE-family HTH domain